MILHPFGYFAIAGLPPVNSVPPSIAVVESNVIGYTPGIWEDAVTIGYVWYSDGVLQGETGTTFAAMPGLPVYVVETAINLRGETVVNSNTITLSGVAIPEITDAAGLSQTITGTFTPASQYSSQPLDYAGITQTILGSFMDSVPAIDSVGLSQSMAGKLIDPMPIGDENGTVTIAVYGSLGTAIDPYGSYVEAGTATFTLTGTYV